MENNGTGNKTKSRGIATYLVKKQLEHVIAEVVVLMDVLLRMKAIKNDGFHTRVARIEQLARFNHRLCCFRCCWVGDSAISN